MKYIILLLSISLNAQIVTQGDLTPLNDVPSNWSLGNVCGEENYINGTVYGDLNLKGNCRILFASLTVTGIIKYNGYTIELVCEESQLIELRLSNKDYKKEKPLLYPNPTKGTVHIETNEEYTLKVYDVLGRFVGDSPDLSGKAPGPYFFVITSGDSVVHKTIIKN